MGAAAAAAAAAEARTDGLTDPQTAEETMEVLYEISKILNTGLDRSTLATLVGLCEAGVNPEALAAVVKELRREGQALEVANEALGSRSGQV